MIDGRFPAWSPVEIMSVTFNPFLRITQADPAGAEGISVVTWVTSHVADDVGTISIVNRPLTPTAPE